MEALTSSQSTSHPSEELYDPATGTFSLTGSLNNTRFEHTAMLLNNGMLLIAGGRITSGPSNGSLAPNEVYDPANWDFCPTGSLLTLRYDHTATLLAGGQVLIAGGLVSTAGPTGPDAAELYNPTTLIPAGLVSIAVTPVAPALSVGATQHFIATDQNGQQLASVTWSSSNNTVLTITNDSTNSGTAYAVGPATGL